MTISGFLPAAVSVIGLIAGLALAVLFAVVIAVLVIVVVANRAEPDETHRRPIAVYLFGASFLSVWLTLIGTVVIVASLVSLMGTSQSGDAAARGASIGAIMAIIAGAILATHLSRGLAIANPNAAGPASRVAQSYVAAVAFVSVFVVLFTLAIAIYSILQLIGPGTYAAASRVDAGRTLIDSGYTALAAFIILLTHLRLIPRELWPRLVRRGGAAPGNGE